MKNIVGRCDGFSKGIDHVLQRENRAFNPCNYYLYWLYWPTTFSFSIIVFNCRASRTILSDSSFFSVITALINVFHAARESVFTCAEISECVRMSSKCCTRFSYCKGMRVACCFLNTAVAFKGRFNSFSIFPTSN